VYRTGPPHELAAWNIPGSGGVIQLIGNEGGKPTMATDRLAEILKSRSDLSDDEIERMSEDEAWQRLRAGVSMRERAHQGPDDCEHQ